MASAAARALQARHAVTAASVALAVRQAILGTARRVDTRDVDAWWDVYGPQLSAVVLQGASASAVLAARFLRDHAAAEGLSIAPEPYRTPAEQVSTSLRVTGPVAFKVAMSRSGATPASARSVLLRDLAAAAERITRNGDRLTVVKAVADGHILGYRRTGTGSSCAFCAMLLGRGAVYSASSVEFHAHDRDDCGAEPVYTREDEPDHVQSLRQRWSDVTRGLSGPEALAEWRRVWTAETR